MSFCRPRVVTLVGLRYSHGTLQINSVPILKYYCAHLPWSQHREEGNVLFIIILLC